MRLKKLALAKDNASSRVEHERVIIELSLPLPPHQNAEAYDVLQDETNSNFKQVFQLYITFMISI